jgi:hypothetical protein
MYKVSKLCNFEILRVFQVHFPVEALWAEMAMVDSLKLIYVINNWNLSHSPLLSHLYICYTYCHNPTNNLNQLKTTFVEVVLLLVKKTTTTQPPPPHNHHHPGFHYN